MFGDSVFEGDGGDVVAFEGGHLAEFAFEDQLGSFDAETGGQHAVIGAGRPAALQVAERDAPSLDFGPLLDEVGDDLADAAELDVAELVGMNIAGNQTRLRQLGAFADHDEAVHFSFGPALLEHGAHVVQVDRHFGNEDVIGGHGNAA